MKLVTKREVIITEFLKLLNRYTLNKITVKKLVKECKINRNTFYYYYDDLYALIGEMFENETKRAIENHSDEDFKKRLLKSINFIMENKQALYNLYYSLNRNQLEEYLYKAMIVIITDYIENKYKIDEFDKEELNFIVHFYKFALSGMTLDWIKNGMSENVYNYVERLDNMFESSLDFAITNCKKII